MHVCVYVWSGRVYFILQKLYTQSYDPLAIAISYILFTKIDLNVYWVHDILMQALFVQKLKSFRWLIIGSVPKHFSLFVKLSRYLSIPYFMNIFKTSAYLYPKQASLIEIALSKTNLPEKFTAHFIIQGI